MRITFLTPRLPPQVCGLADHTRNLAESLTKLGVGVGFIHRQADQRQFELPVGPVDYWDDSPRSLIETVRKQKADWFWVQLSGYGYSRWGSPYRLARALAGLRRAVPEVRIAVYLHEPHCDASHLGLKGLPLSLWQKHTIGRIIRSADVVFTSTEPWRRRILAHYGSREEALFRLPIGANVPRIDLCEEERAARRRELGFRTDHVIAVTFGSFPMQVLALERFETILQRGLTAGRLHRIVCVGGGPFIPPELARWQRRFSPPDAFAILGHRPAAEVARILACSDFAFFATSREYLEKSTGFVAAAHAGLAVLTLPDPAMPARDDNLPVIAAEQWDWERVDAMQVSELRHRLRCYVEKHHAWDAIAARAVARLQTTDRGSAVALVGKGD